MTLRTKTLLSALAVLLAAVSVAGSASAKTRLDGALTVSNERHVSMAIRIDGVPRGNIPAKAKRTVRHIPNGIRLVELIGPRGGSVVHELSIAPRKTSALRLAPRFGAAKIVNKSGVTLKVSLDGRYFATIRNGQRIKTGPMKPGRYLLTATANGGAFKGPMLKRRLDITPGKKLRIRLDGYLSTLHVTNPFGRGTRLFVDGINMGRMRAGEMRSLGGLTPGLHRIVFKRRGRILTNQTVTLPMGASHRFTPRVATLGSVRVTNAFNRRVKLVINGVRVGSLAAGETRTFRNVPAGAISGFAKLGRGQKVAFTVQIRPNTVSPLLLTAAKSHPRPRPINRPAAW